MRRVPALAMTALVILFLAEGQRALFASMLGLAYDGLFPRPSPGRALLALLPLLALLVPLVPLPRWTDRDGAVAVAAAAAAIFRLPMTWPALETRLIGGTLVLAAGATFLTWAVGRVEQRALAGGVVLGLVLDQLLRLAGTSYDVSLQPGWLPVQGLLSLLALGAVFAWSRVAEDPAGSDGDSPGLERRTGGLRLRGGLALGALLFMDLHVVGIPATAARWAGVSHTFAAAAVTVAGALGLLAALALRRPSRGRVTSLALAGLLVAGPLLALAGRGPVVALVMAAGHLSALLLVTRALDPASGRRSGRTVTAGFAVLAFATLIYSLALFPSFPLSWMESAMPVLFGAVGLLLAGSFVLLPRPAELEPLPGAAAVGAGTAIALVGALLLLFVPGRSPTSGGPAGTEADLRVATWNGHYGFDRGWRFDPGALAAALTQIDADVVALQEMGVGAPFVYGVDLPLWLAHQIGADDHFDPDPANGLLGDALLSTIPVTSVTSRTPPGADGGQRLLTLAASVAGTELRFHVLHRALDAEPRDRPPQSTLDALLEPGPGETAVIVGDLDAGPAGAVADRLMEAGFQDVFDRTTDTTPTDPDRPTARSSAGIWVRGLDVVSVSLLQLHGSDHRPVVAVLRVPDLRPEARARERTSPGGR